MALGNIFSGKRILVTGASGLIGSNLVRRLVEFPGVEIVACGRNSKKLASVFVHELGKGVRIFEHDIVKPLPVNFGDFDFIFHAAAPISGAVIKSEPLASIMANFRGAENCLEFLKKQKESRGRIGTFVVFSSATVYGVAMDAERTCSEDETYYAEDLTSSTAPYSESKRMVEVLATAYGRQCGINVRIARFSYVYGKCEVLPNTAFYEFVNCAAKGEDMVFKGAGFGRRDNIYVDDAVEGLLTICEHGENFIPYNVSSNGELGNYAAIDEIASSIGRAAAGVGINSKVVLGTVAARSPGLKLNNARLKGLGWCLKTSLDDGVREIFLSMGGSHEA